MDTVMLDGLLERTSRTFALSIPMLPEPTRRHVGIAYLLFRVADTFEDAAAWTREQKLEALAEFSRLLDGEGFERDAARRWLADPPVEHSGYLELLRETPAVLASYRDVPAPARAILRRDLGRTVEGMAAVVRRGDASGHVTLASVRELRDYCYVVAGIVGEMLTELFLTDAAELRGVAPRLRRRARFFGEGLQLVNILKDVSADAVEGRAYLPREVDRARVIALARGDIAIAARYVATLQGAGAPEGFVAFTGSPAVLARASLARIESEPVGAKLTRPEVAALMERMFADLAEGRALL